MRRPAFIMEKTFLSRFMVHFYNNFTTDPDPHTEHQCFGSASVFCGSGSGSYLKLNADPDSDPDPGSGSRIRIHALTKKNRYL
jgi:hypothetical protein